MRHCTIHALYWSKLWQQDHCHHPQNANLDGSTLEGIAQCTGQPFGGGGAEGHITPPHIFEVGFKVNTKVYLDVLKSVVIPWCNQVAGGRPWVWQQDLVLPTSPKRPRLGFRRSTTSLYPSFTGPAPPPTWTHWTTLFGHTSKTWPPITPKPAWSLPSAEYSPSSRWRLWKRHAPSSESVSWRWLRLKAATLNRC